MEMNMLRKQSVAIAILQSIVKHIERLFAAAKLPPHVDQPKAANQESRLRPAEIILAGITHNVLAPDKFTFDGPVFYSEEKNLEEAAKKQSGSGS